MADRISELCDHCERLASEGKPAAITKLEEGLTAVEANSLAGEKLRRLPAEDLMFLWYTYEQERGEAMGLEFMLWARHTIFLRTAEIHESELPAEVSANANKARFNFAYGR